MKEIILYLIFIIKVVLGEECQRDKPIYKENECQLTYCTKEQFKNGICKINNSIINKQWLTHIIMIGEPNYRFLNFANFSNGTMIIEVSPDKDELNKRIFFGLNADGSYLFKDNVGNHQIKKEVNGEPNTRKYAENFVVKIDNGNAGTKEYLVSVPNEDQNAELYDFENDQIFTRNSTSLIGQKILSIKHSSSNALISGYNLLIFQSWVEIHTDCKYSFRTTILEFKSTDITQAYNVMEGADFQLNNRRSEITSSFISKSNYIWTIGFIEEFERFAYYIIIYSPLNLQQNVYMERFEAYPFYERTFFKLVHLKEDIGVGVFFSYPYFEKYQNNSVFPSFLVRRMEGKKLVNYFDSDIIQTEYNHSIIMNFNDKLFNFDCLLNDLIKISDYKVSLITMDLYKENLYVIMLEIYSPKDFFLKLYEVKFFQLYNIKFFQEISAHLFEQHISFGFNYCHTTNCENSSDTYYSSLIVFSYPNSTDGYLNINQYFEENKGTTFDDITIDLNQNVYIENNIFGYVFSNINIFKLDGCENILLISTNGNEINANTELLQDERIKIQFRNKMKAFDCKIYFRLVLTEPIYTEDEKYYIESISSNDFTNYEETYNNKRRKYPGKISLYNIKFDYIEPTYAEEIKTSSVATIKDIPKQTEFVKLEKTYIREDNICSNEEVLANKCGDGEIEVGQIKDLFNQFSTTILTFNLGGDMKIIETQNVVLQIVLLNAQDIGLNPNVSFVNIGECEKILKEKYNINESDSLIMVKSDSKNKDGTSSNVMFDLYHPITRQKLNMSYCNDVEIKIDIPTQLENNTIDLYDSLLESGYNLFDSNDSFYNDACSTYTSTNGTDMILSDRQNIIYSQAGNISLCQTGCSFSSYNKTLKTVQCDCNVQSTSSESDSEGLDTKELKNSFLSTILNSNFIILKCIKMAFSIKDIFSNKGRIAMTIIIFFFIIIIIIFFVNDKNTLNKYFKLILDEKMNMEEHNTSKNNDKDDPDLNNDPKSDIDSTIKINIKGKNEIINMENNYNNNEIKEEKQMNNNLEIKNQFPPKKARLKSNSKKIITTKIIEAKRLHFNNYFSAMIKSSKEELNKINFISDMKLKERLKFKEKMEKRNRYLTDRGTDENEMYKKMNDDELNSLEYEKALLYDKRTFFQYYWSLLKKDQILLFTFIPTNDYNLVSLKMTLFILSLSLEITINGFFFTDNTMHQIHENNGKFDLIYQIPQILYSSIISTIINSLLQKLALSEDSFLSLKQIKNYDKAIKQCETIKKCLTIKFICFIITSFILMLFCWYYISSFCAVYTNTQSILFKDTLISMLLSMVYPFGLCLLPGLCRIPALQAENKDKKCLYKFSGFVELI